MSALNQLEACGQSPWLDYLKRSLIETGQLRMLIERDGIKGLTSNPSIFEKAIGETDEYAGALARFQASGHGISAICEHLAIADIRAAADAPHPAYARTPGRDGYASLECSPCLANDTEATVAEALRLWEAVARPNLMVKVPAAPAGLPAIRQLIGRGLNINVTLLFAVSVYADVAEAYISGLEDLARTGGDIGAIGSVASMFVSRIDTAVDKRLDRLSDRQVADHLRGRVAIANAKLAYLRYNALFSGARWQRLAASGARTPRLLWASTSTKIPAYKDTMYVEALIGRDTVDTIPPATMDAFRDHGAATPDAIEQNVDAARATLTALERTGISLTQVTDGLVKDGERARITIAPGSLEMKAALGAEMEAWRADGRIRRLWAGDTTLWTGTEGDEWLGWLRITEQEQADVDRLVGFADEVRQRGCTNIVLLGMGGSSLGPEVLAETFDQQAGWPRFHMLDSTDPAQIMAVEHAIDLNRTLFIVSSKSGSTLEPHLFMDYFIDRVGVVRGKDRAGEHFVAVTDPGSALERRATQLRFAHIFHGVPSIGGRYSVLSKFALVPAAAMGLDIKRLLAATRPMERTCGPDVPPAENPGVQLGVALVGAAAHLGRDKVTIIAGDGIADLGAWLEQLLAESTGKQQRGLIPLAGEPLTTPEHCGNDRFFVHLELDGEIDPSQRQAVASLEPAGHPVVRIGLKDVWHIGQEFFRWEVATAVARAIIGMDPFDQPDAEASKDKTRALNASIRETLHEDQIFQIGHFLGKETVQNLMAFRFANGLFEPIWNRDRIDHVQITVAETVGVEQRGKFCEATRELRDRVPNHAFTLLSMVAMEPPAGFDAASTLTKRAEMFAALPAAGPEQAVRGQYRAGAVLGQKVRAYRHEPNVAADSNTETCVALKLEIDNWRWAGVPFYIRTGEHRSERTTEIAIRSKRAPFAAFQGTGVETLQPNWLALGIAPDEKISLQFEVKRRGPVVDLAPAKLEFNCDDWFPKEPSVGHETLLYDVMIGDPTLFMRADMVEQAWRIVQPVLDDWAAKTARFPDYASGSDGPKAADDLLAHDGGRAWRPIGPTLARTP